MALECLTKVLGPIFKKICRGAGDKESDDDEEEEEEEEGDDDDDDDEELFEAFRELPNCLMIDIVSRLPLDTFIRCRRNCRDLRYLMSSRYFTTLHLSRDRQPTMFLLQDYCNTSKRRKQLHVLSCKQRKTLILYESLNLRPHLLNNKRHGYSYRPQIMFSCQGVVLLANSPTTYYVLNPTTQEEVIVQHTHQPGILCALYYSSPDRQFKLLYAQIRAGITYLVYIFKTQTWRKIRSSTSSTSNFNLLPDNRSPAAVNGALHWIMYSDLEEKRLPPPPHNSCGSNGIIVFKMDKEQLSAKPHPGSVCYDAEQDHRMMTLSVKENCLSFCHLNPMGAIDIWILEDYEMWAWNKRYKVDVTRCEYLPADMYRWIKPAYFLNGHLFCSLEGEGILIFDLDHKIYSKGILMRNRMLRPFGSYIKTLMPIA